MATTYQNVSRPIRRPTVQQSQTKKTTSKQPPARITNKSNEIKIQFGNNSVQNSMYKPSSILKKKPFNERNTAHSNQTLSDWHPPSDLEAVKLRHSYSPIRTPPRLRTLLTPPGIDSYQDDQNLRRISGPLPGITGRYSPPLTVNTFGLDNSLNSTLNLMRRYPSPLTHYGLGTDIPRQPKSYVVLPRLNNFISPPVSSGGTNFILPSQEASDYLYIRRNEAFANSYIEEFIGRCIEDQFIPDILLEIINENDQNKKQGGNFYKTKVDQHYADINKRISRGEANNTHLFSDEWIREVDNPHLSMPTSIINSTRSTSRSLNITETASVRTTSRLRYNDLPTDVQGRLLADINQEVIDFELQNMITDLSNQTLINRTHHVPVRNDNRHEIQSKTEREVIYDTTDEVNNIERHQIQYDSVEKHASNKLLDTIHLNELIRKTIKQNGTSIDFDDSSRLLDVTILDNLIWKYQKSDEHRSRTLDNHA